jgi:cardiolipin synthase
MLTILRFICIPVYIGVFLSGDIKLAFMVLITAGVTDVLDGYIARTQGLVTELGTMLDPLADKLMLITVIISLLLSGMIPWPAAAVFFIRDAGMIVGGILVHVKGMQAVPANAMGKITTVLFYIAILMIVFDIAYAIPYLWFVISFSFVATLLYIGKVYKLRAVAEKPHGKRAHF